MYLLLFLLMLLLMLSTILGRYIGYLNFKKLFLFFFLNLLLISVLAFFEVVVNDFTCNLPVYNWINLLTFRVEIIFLFDKLSTSMLFLILTVSFLVHLYAIKYMEGDGSVYRFFFFLTLFTFFMCLLVVSNNLVQFFLAWEGVGISSYLLINFWYTRIEANRAAMKALLINRVGDFGLYLAILLLFAFFKALNFTNINSLLLNEEGVFLLTFFNWELQIEEIICLAFIVAVVGKSAQLGLHTWLPDAMEGPTPVSALLHAATMVTAGIFLLLRISPFVAQFDNILILICFWGGLTAFFASSIGAFQNDLKKIIAYSTCSQLGYMLAAIGFTNFAGAYFHLFNHAFFKALLFLGAGSLIHALADEQDLRKYGRLSTFLPLTYFSMFIATLSLVGAPFLSGFYSKEIIINWAFTNYEYFTNKIYWLLIFAAFFTSYYSTKLLFLTFFSEASRYNLSKVINISESGYQFKFPLFVLSILSIVSGFLFFDLFVGYGGEMLYLPLILEKNLFLELEYLNQLRKFTPLVITIGGALSYLTINFYFCKKFNTLLKNRFNLKVLIIIKNFFNKKWFFDYFYYYLTIQTTNFGYYILFKNIDRGVLEKVFIKKSVYLLVSLGYLLANIKSSVINKNIWTFIKIFLFIITFFLLNVTLLSFFSFFLLASFWRKYNENN